MAMHSNPISCGDDDKYTKFAWSQKQMHGLFQKYHETTREGNHEIIWCSYVLLGLAYIHLGGHPGHSESEKLLNFSSISMEVFGLLVLRHKIQSRQSVRGVSGMTLLMYAACYAVRIWLTFPVLSKFNLMEMEIEASFGVFSLLLVLDCLWSVFVTHRSSYQAHFDVLHVKYLLPGCCLLALVLRAEFRGWSPFFAFMWTSCLYMDVLALMPQVVMMARGGGKVEAPIAHFVAATFFSRIQDLSDSLVFQSGTVHEDEFLPFCLIIFFQGLHVLLVADFMYYYVKARTSEKELDNSIIEV